ncbi:MAG: cryptochrome/photolyase family protein, partial [Nostoc sp.]
VPPWQEITITISRFSIGWDFYLWKESCTSRYINKMSDYCKSCVYNHKERVGKNACPFNFFYWDFLDRHRQQLESQGRMSFILKNLDKMSAEELQSIRQQAQDWHAQL